jgi:DNA-binding NarL/FixJ family response regulator
MRILVYSPVRLFGDCLAAFLQSEEAVQAVQTESNALDLDRRTMAFKADVVLVDITVAPAFAAARLIKVLSPDVATVAMAVTEIPEDILSCAQSGFDAYVPRNARPKEMMDIILRADQGETICDPRIARVLFNELGRRQSVGSSQLSDARLTPREVDIARMLSGGATNKEIAADLHLSVATIKNHVHSVLHKLQVDSRSQVAAILMENPMTLRGP